MTGARFRLKEALYLLDDASRDDLAKLTGKDLRKLVELCRHWGMLAEGELATRLSDFQQDAQFERNYTNPE